jgi:hypothetical protein
MDMDTKSCTCTGTAAVTHIITHGTLIIFILIVARSNFTLLISGRINKSIQPFLHF